MAVRVNKHDLPPHVQRQIEAKLGSERRASVNIWAPYANQWESRYAEHLKRQELGRKIVAWWYGRLKIVLPGQRNTYLPDFLVQPTSGPPEIREVKGFWRDDARVKFKTAAGLLSCFRFCVVSWNAHSRSWDVEYVD